MTITAIVKTVKILVYFAPSMSGQHSKLFADISRMPNLTRASPWLRFGGLPNVFTLQNVFAPLYGLPARQIGACAKRACL